MRQVYISYITQDQGTAARVCAYLESQELPCWLALRDMPLEADPDRAILKAIRSSAVMVVLLSYESAQAPQILREIEQALRWGLPLVVLRLGEARLPDPLLHLHSTAQWVYARGEPTAEDLEILAAKVVTLPVEGVVGEGGNGPAIDLPWTDEGPTTDTTLAWSLSPEEASRRLADAATHSPQRYVSPLPPPQAPAYSPSRPPVEAVPIPQPAPTIPKPPRFRSLTAPAEALAVLMAFTALVCLGLVYADTLHLQLTARMAALDRVVARQELIRADNLMRLLSLWKLTLLLADILVFMFWLQRAYKNLLALGTQGLNYSSGWAIGSFFVPILCWFQPYLVVRELWQASDDSGQNLRDPTAWRSARVSALVPLWWAAWLLCHIAGLVQHFQGQWQHLEEMSSGDLGSMSGLLWSDLVLHGAVSMAALLVVPLVLQISRMQAQKHGNFSWREPGEKPVRFFLSRHFAAATALVLTLLTLVGLFLVWQRYIEVWDDWRTVASVEGRFRVEMPARPIERTQAGTMSTIPITIIQCVSEGIQYVVSYADREETLPMEAADMLFDQYRDAQFQRLQNSGHTEQRITLDGYPGRELVMTFSEPPEPGVEAVKIHVYLVGNRLYHVMAATTQGRLGSPEITRFLDSFRLQGSR